MTQTLTVRFDGKVLIPDGPVDLPVGQPLKVQLEFPDNAAPRFADLVQFAADLPDAPTDLASQHDHYLYGSPKK